MEYKGKLEEAVKSEGTMHSPIEQRLESTQELLQHVTKSLQDAISRQVALERYLGISIQKEDNYVIYEGGIANYKGDLIIKKAPSKKWYQFWK